MPPEYTLIIGGTFRIEFEHCQEYFDCRPPVHAPHVRFRDCTYKLLYVLTRRLEFIDEPVCASRSTNPDQTLATRDPLTAFFLSFDSQDYRIHFPPELADSFPLASQGQLIGAKEPEPSVSPAVVPSQSTRLPAETDWARRYRRAPKPYIAPTSPVQENPIPNGVLDEPEDPDRILGPTLGFHD